MSDFEGVLEQELTYLKGVGPRKGAVLEAHGLKTVRDLLEFYPRRYLDRTSVVRVRDIDADVGEISIVGRVGRCEARGFGRRMRFEATLHDGTGEIGMVWFNRVHWIKGFLKTGDVIAASGKPGSYRGGWQLQHPAVEKLSLDPEATEDAPVGVDFEYRGQIVPIYPGTEELRKAWLDSRAISRIVHGLYRGRAVEPEDPLPESVRERHRLVGLADALRDVHLGESLEDVGAARRRLKFQELFMLELMLAWRKAAHQAQPVGVRMDAPGELPRRLLASLPFELTGDQRSALEEILGDMRSEKPMNRLLQGDVGCGKTLVALAAMLLAVESGHQAALMAPTEILAEQHWRTVTSHVDALGMRVTLLTGSRKAESRRRALQEIAGGWAQIVIGTHALFQEGVEFADLGLAVIDEQHRFGVEQRARLKRKGGALDTLVMTATPIPRTLAIVSYGDMDLSLIREKPPGRQPVTTTWRREGKRAAIFDFVRKRVEDGAQAYVVYPLVEESEKLDLRAAEEAKTELEAGPLAGIAVGLLHGRMKPAEKEAAMMAFLAGEIRVLVSTTVIEVGVDNPNATVMVVEQAERFGLSQLHQLRGRVGRGGGKSYCILVAGKELSHEGKERLETMAATDDGFEIAEVDLRMRGAGDFFGTRQSGLPELKIADVVKDVDLLVQARDAAFELVARDRGLRGEPALKRYLLERHGERMARVED